MARLVIRRLGRHERAETDQTRTDALDGALSGLGLSLGMGLVFRMLRRSKTAAGRDHGRVMALENDGVKPCSPGARNAAERAMIRPRNA
jgi:hypothetical protein